MQILQLQMDVTLKVCISDPMMVKPKWVWEVAVFCVKSKFFEKFQKITSFSKIKKCYIALEFEPGTSSILDQSSTSRPQRKLRIDCHFSCIYFKCLKKSADTKKTATCQTHFGFTKIAWEMNSFRPRVIWNKKFRFGSPCICLSIFKLLFRFCIFAVGEK